MNIRRYYDTFSETYDRERHQGYHRWLDERSTALVEDFARDSRTLEVGCGTGLILKGVTTIAKNAIGLDLSHGMLSACRAGNLQTVQASATEIPFADNQFDLVYSFKVLAHVPNIESALAEMARVTRPGGHMVLEFYNRTSLRYLIRRLRPAGRVGPETDESDVYTRFDSLAELSALLPSSVTLSRIAGLRVATVAPQLFKIPGFGRAWAGLENLLSATPLRRFGGFLVLICRKQVRS